jgi:hypothetical protein
MGRSSVVQRNRGALKKIPQLFLNDLYFSNGKDIAKA